MDRLTEAFKNLPKPYKWGLILGVVVAMLLIGGGVNRATSYFERRAFEKELKVEKDLRQKDIEKANAAEARAVAAESEKSKYQIAFELAGAKAEQAMEKVNEAEIQFNQEAANIGVDIDPVERCLRLCAKFKLTPEQCACTKVGDGQ